MNIEMLAVHIAVISLIFVPCLILVYCGRVEYRKINDLFKKEARKNGLSIDVKDRWNLNAIGIDHRKQKLLFIQRRNDELFVELISLCSIKQSQIRHHSLNTKINGVEEILLQKIELELIPLDGTDVILVSLFDSDLTFDQDYEMKHAEKWNRIINSNLSLNPITQKVA